MWCKVGPTLAQRYQNMQITHSFADSAEVTKMLPKYLEVILFIIVTI